MSSKIVCCFKCQKSSEDIYSWEEVQKHNQPRNCWVVIRNNVYDLSEFAFIHDPGGKLVHKYAGKSADDVFENYHIGNKYRNLLKKYKIGTLQSL